MTSDAEIERWIEFHAEFQRRNKGKPLWLNHPLPEGYVPPTGPPVFHGTRPKMKLRKPLETKELE